MAKPLTVYKASAGSGKTFTLAVEYIKLLVQNPNNFRNILAVTFTNKATEEMKMRIVSQMYGIWKGYDDSKSYIEKLCSDLQCSEDFLRGRIGVALHLLLHNYSFFRVETIDSFFQSVLRNLARELDLTANLRIELNDRQVEELAVDRMIDDLKSDDDVMRWIMDYIYDNMQEDKTWNVIGQIKSFGATIFKDYYKDHHTTLAAAMSKPDFFADYVKSLKETTTLVVALVNLGNHGDTIVGVTFLIASVKHVCHSIDLMVLGTADTFCHGCRLILLLVEIHFLYYRLNQRPRV